MHRRFAGIRLILAFFGLLALNACTVEAPAGPSLPVMPGDGKSLSQFQQDDATCRQFANDRIGISPSTAANQAGLGSAAVGTVAGAAAGAAIGAAAGNPAAGAAIGAGAGLLTGGAVGVGNAATFADSIQQRYDLAYQQCMAATGNKTSIAVAPAPAAPAPQPPAAAVIPVPEPVPAPAPVYVYPPPYYYPPYAYYGPYPYSYPRPYDYARPYWGPRFSFYFGGGGYHHGHHW